MSDTVDARRAGGRLVARLDLDATVPEWALGYRWDIVVAGHQATPFEDQEDQEDG